MADRPGPSYGTPNFEMLGRWMQLGPTGDGPFWALNLMKYHAVAQYAAGGAPDRLRVRRRSSPATL